ncbi:MAG: hypothetical protein GX054_07645 [Clostridiales bacterium]|jgi:hypothetical protein|nr:hypothetical protein [Clostridiales bacterium]
MFCPSCNTRNKAYNNYCYYCGYKLRDKDSNKKHSYDQEKMYVDLDHDMDLGLEEQYRNEEDSFEESFIIDTEFDSTDDTTHDPGYDKAYDYFSEKIERDALLDSDDDIFDVETPDLDLTTQMPLRRYKKDKTAYKRKRAANITLTIFILIALATLIFLAAMVGMRKFASKNPDVPNIGQSIAVSSAVEETTIQGKKAYRIVFNTVNGQEVSFLGDVLEVDNGRAEFIVEEGLLYSYDPELNEDGLYEVHLDAIISAPNLENAVERVSITLSPPYNYAPFTLLQPSSSETEFQGDSTTVSFKVQPDSELYINDQDYTSAVSADGRFEQKFSLPADQEQLILNIRVSSPGYLDNIQQIILRKSPMDVKLTINETSPIFSDEPWVKISGTVEPGAIIETSLEIFEEPEINEETGEFSLYVKAERPGYTLCNLTAKLNGKETSTEVVLEREANVHTYTSTAWKPIYSDLQQDEQLSNGRHFVFSGNIKEILETGDKNVFIVSLSEQGEEEELFYVEYWGGFDFNTGDPIRVFANRWGNKDGIPRFLAKYIYEI